MANVTLSWEPEEIISLVLICLLLPVVILGNLLVILSVARYRRLQIPTNMFITSLSVSDILSGLFSPLLLSTELNKELITDVYLCVAPYCGVLMGICISTLTLASIAFDRYTACVFPMEYVYVITVTRISFILVTTWAIGILLTWVMIMTMTSYNDVAIASCTLNAVTQDALIVLLTVVLLPCGVFIFFCYTKIFMVARHHVKAISAIERAVNARTLRHFKRDTKYAKTLGFVITGFLVLSLPLEISILVRVASGVRLDERIVSVCVLLALLNGAINPWIYAYRNAEFRSAFRAILGEAGWPRGVDQGKPGGKDECTLSRCDSRLDTEDMIRDAYSQCDTNTSPALSNGNGHASPV